MKALFKSLALMGLAICSILAYDVIDDNPVDNTVPLRTHSIYMPYIGKSKRYYKIVYMIF